MTCLRGFVVSVVWGSCLHTYGSYDSENLPSIESPFLQTWGRWLSGHVVSSRVAAPYRQPNGKMQALFNDCHEE